MSAYIKLPTMEYPRHQGDIRLEYPEIGEHFVCPDTYALVVETTPPPVNNEFDRLVEIKPLLENGVWKQQWLVRPATQEEIDAKKALDEYIKSISRPNQDVTQSGTAPDVIG